MPNKLNDRASNKIDNSTTECPCRPSANPLDYLKEPAPHNPLIDFDEKVKEKSFNELGSMSSPTWLARRK